MSRENKHFGQVDGMEGLQWKVEPCKSAQVTWQVGGLALQVGGLALQDARSS